MESDFEVSLKVSVKTGQDGGISRCAFSPGRVLIG